MKEKRGIVPCDAAGLAAFVTALLAGCWNLLRSIAMGDSTVALTFLIVDAVFALTAYAAWKGRMPWLLLVNAAGGGTMFYITNYILVDSLLQPALLAEVVVSAVCLVVGTVDVIRCKRHIRRIPYVPMAAAAVIVVGFLLTWMYNVNEAKSAQGHAHNELWAVPQEYDAPGCDQPGTVETLTYQTKAYGTDGRAVEKQAQIYLPYGYDESEQYNILYLMHGTGDDEKYWLTTHSYNKDMLDRLIASGEIEPLIVVTPTFYTEDDFADDLDQLTYAFRDELRYDLMPAVESRYSTYAESCDEAGFTASRDHRAFAGLSRGSVTACHAALCGNLDYFSWFGMFSAFRTDDEYLKQTLQSEEYAQYPINYLYMSCGNFDFAMNWQIDGYQRLLELEPRLTQGVNYDIDVYPMRYHSIGCWHLSLYNFLQRIF